MFLTAVIRNEDGLAVGVLVLKPRTFSSGKAGYFGQGKVEIDGRRYQCQAQAVKIGPPEDEAGGDSI